jgi:hypothetical protein
MTTCTLEAWKRTEFLGKHAVKMIAMSLVSGDDTVTVNTGLKIIYSWSVSAPGVTAKPLDYATVSGGTITQYCTDPSTAGETLYFTAYGIL